MKRNFDYDKMFRFIGWNAIINVGIFLVLYVFGVFVSFDVLWPIDGVDGRVIVALTMGCSLIVSLPLTLIVIYE